MWRGPGSSLLASPLRVPVMWWTHRSTFPIHSMSLALRSDSLMWRQWWSLFSLVGWRGCSIAVFPKCSIAVFPEWVGSPVCSVCSFSVWFKLSDRGFRKPFLTPALFCYFLPNCIISIIFTSLDLSIRVDGVQNTTVGYNNECPRDIRLQFLGTLHGAFGKRVCADAVKDFEMGSY